MKIKASLLKIIMRFGLWLSETGSNLFSWAYDQSEEYWSDLFINPVPWEYLDEPQKDYLFEIHGWSMKDYNQYHDLDRQSLQSDY